MAMSEYLRNLRARVGHDLLMMPAVGAIILNEDGHVLLQRRTDNNQWGLPGGAIDPGEEISEALIREVKEETGLDVVLDRLTGVYAGKEYITTYPNGDTVQIIAIIFICRITGGELLADGDGDETAELRYFPVNALPENTSHRAEIRLMDAMQMNERAMFR